MNRAAGFTLIELIIVIAIIGILLTITGFVSTNVLSSSRDSERADDVASIARLLEDDYTNQVAGSPSYPPMNTFISDIASSSGSASGADSSIFTAPGASGKSVLAATATSATVPAGTGSPTTIQYYYQALTASNQLCSTSSQTCVLYRLFYRQQSDNKVIVVNSTHQQ